MWHDTLVKLGEHFTFCSWVGVNNSSHTLGVVCLNTPPPYGVVHMMGGVHLQCAPNLTPMMIDGPDGSNEDQCWRFPHNPNLIPNTLITIFFTALLLSLCSKGRVLQGYFSDPEGSRTKLLFSPRSA